MRLAFVEKLRSLLEGHPVIAMKDHAFEQGFDDLGQAEGDVERQQPEGELGAWAQQRGAPPVSRA